MPRVSKENRGRIIGLWEAGKSYKEIADTIGCSKVTAIAWVKAWNDGRRLTDLHRLPRGRVTSPQLDNEIVACSVVKPTMMATEIRNEIQAQHVSVDTIRRRLNESGLYHHVAATKERLSAAHKLWRFNFAQAHLAWNNEWPTLSFLMR